MKVEDLKLWDTLEVVTAMPGIPGGMIGVVAGVNSRAQTVTCVATFEIPFECIEHDKVRHVSKNPAFIGADLMLHDQAEVISNQGIGGMVEGSADLAQTADPLAHKGMNESPMPLDSRQMHLPALIDAVPTLTKSIQTGYLSEALGDMHTTGTGFVKRGEDGK